MRIAIASVQVPFVSGGAECLTRGLERRLTRAGHDVALVTLPFRFHPAAEVARNMEAWSLEDLRSPNGVPIDRVICIKFPAYYLSHPNKFVWLAHQHREVYELWNADPLEPNHLSPEDWTLRWLIRKWDRQNLPDCTSVFTISKTVSARLLHFNGIDSQPLYHPPPLGPAHYSKASEPFIFCPSRLEPHKRQRLLIEAMKHVGGGIRAVVAGVGGMKDVLAELVEGAGLGDRVRLIGAVSTAEILDLYARCLAVFFGPYDEDYGYVTLEAMLSSKPVITCRDSGGPLEFVVAGETGLVVEPAPEAIASAIDRLYRRRSEAAQMGREGRRHYDRLGISWDPVVFELTQ